MILTDLNRNKKIHLTNHFYFADHSPMLSFSNRGDTSSPSRDKRDIYQAVRLREDTKLEGAHYSDNESGYKTHMHSSGYLDDIHTDTHIFPKGTLILQQVFSF